MSQHSPISGTTIPGVFGLPRAAVDRSTWILRLALGAGLLVRLLILAQTDALGPRIVDEQHYTAIAQNLAAGEGFGWSPGQLTSIRPPLYPALVAGLWSVAGGTDFQIVRIAQILIALLTTALVYALGAEIFSRRVGRYAAAIFWLYPSFIFFNFLILTETLFTFLLVLTVYLSVRLVQAPRLSIALGCGAALALGALTRSVLWPAPLLLCPAVGWLMAGSMTRRIGYPVALLAAFVLVLTPWAVRNTRLQGVVTIVDTMGGTNLRMGNYEYTPEDRMWDGVALQGEKHWVTALSREYPGRAFTEGEKDKWAQRKAIEYIVANPVTTARRAVIKFGDFWGLEREFIAGVQQGFFSPPVWITVAGTALMLVAFPVVLFGGVAGAFFARAADWRGMVLLLLPVAIVTGLHTIVFGHPRYHLPLVPMLGILTAALVVQWESRFWRDRKGAVLATAVMVAILAAFWARQILFVDADRIQRLFQHVA